MYTGNLDFTHNQRVLEKIFQVVYSKYIVTIKFNYIFLFQYIMQII